MDIKIFAAALLNKYIFVQAWLKESLILVRAESALSTGLMCFFQIIICVSFFVSCIYLLLLNEFPINVL